MLHYNKAMPHHYLKSYVYVSRQKQNQHISSRKEVVDAQPDFYCENVSAIGFQ